MTCRRSQVRVLYRPPKQEPLTLVRGFFVASSTNPRQSRTVQDSNRAALTTPVGRVSNQPSGLLLSPGFPTTRNVYQERCSQTFWSGDFCGGRYRTRTGQAHGLRLPAAPPRFRRRQRASPLQFPKGVSFSTRINATALFFHKLSLWFFL